MTPANILLVLELLIRLSTSLTKVSELLKKAHDEGRDITDEELVSLSLDDDQARIALEAAIAAARLRNE